MEPLGPGRKKMSFQSFVSAAMTLIFGARGESFVALIVDNQILEAAISFYIHTMIRSSNEGPLLPAYRLLPGKL